MKTLSMCLGGSAGLALFPFISLSRSGHFYAVSLCGPLSCVLVVFFVSLHPCVALCLLSLLVTASFALSFLPSFSAVNVSVTMSPSVSLSLVFPLISPFHCFRRSVTLPH